MVLLLFLFCSDPGDLSRADHMHLKGNLSSESGISNQWRHHWLMAAPLHCHSSCLQGKAQWALQHLRLNVGRVGLLHPLCRKLQLLWCHESHGHVMLLMCFSWCSAPFPSSFTLIALSSEMLLEPCSVDSLSVEWHGCPIEGWRLISHLSSEPWSVIDLCLLSLT